MDNQFSGHPTGNSVVAVVFGSLSSIGHSLMQINMTDWAMHTTLKVVEVGFVGLVGGACGLLGKKLVERYFMNKK